MAETKKEEGRVIAVVVASNKGGVGKTTTVVQLGTGLSSLVPDVGAIVLIDGDAQGHLGAYLGIGSAGDFAAALRGKKAITECLTPVEGCKRLWVMRGNEETWELERGFVKGAGQKGFQPLAERLRDLLQLLTGLVEEGQKVLVIIDTAPSYSEIQTAALLVADYILCPLTPTIGGEMGMFSMWEWVRELGSNARKGFGVLPQMYDLENPIHKRTLRTVQNMTGKISVYPAIPYSVELAEALDTGVTVWASRKLKGSPVAQRYGEVLERLAGELGLEPAPKKKDK
jgi:chromosome partitioning protein